MLVCGSPGRAPAPPLSPSISSVLLCDVVCGRCESTETRPAKSTEQTQRTREQRKKSRERRGEAEEESERERERERERDRERQRDRETDRQRERERERESGPRMPVSTLVGQSGPPTRIIT
eukprot:3940742-Rhodomonas_salina.2